MSPKMIFLWVCGALLIAAVCAAILLRPRESGERPLPDFKTHLASNLEDWTWEDRPPSDSEAVLDAIEDMLDYDESLYRVYQNGDTIVTLWAAYWSPGKTDMKSVVSHQPEICWVAGGWEVKESRENVELEIPGLELKSGRYRLMSKNERSDTHIVFWHLIGGNSIKLSAKSVNLGRNLQIVQQLGIRGLRDRSEQYFFRITSNRPFEDLDSDPDFRRILESLAQYGLDAETRDVR